MTEKQMEKILQEYINSMKSFATSKVILKAARYYVDSVNKIWTIEDVLKDPEKASNSHISDMERAYCDGFTDACELLEDLRDLMF
ncbi:hypothetical protein [Ileibacterium valens]|uniref:hypothetical protein n=1 Tax=Ileibacterium valens TaxID=1862668 RepID=UPI00272BFAD3|nr:hypothetical protein [Ileibacterium valens]